MFDVGLNNSLHIKATAVDTTPTTATNLVDTGSGGILTEAQVSGAAGVYVSAVTAVVFWRADGATVDATNGHPIDISASIWLPATIARDTQVISATGAVVASSVEARSS